MSIFIKRKRGRPRRDEPREINDIDIALIQEFQKRPCFYDRTHQQYRNREYLEPQWEEMANVLGFNVTSIKDRMLQLRNRYNLEKRRVENLQQQYNNQDIKSQWVLYESLAFLGEHIKSRRAMSALIPELKIKHLSETNSSESGAEDVVASHHLGPTALAKLHLQLHQQHRSSSPLPAIYNQFNTVHNDNGSNTTNRCNTSAIKAAEVTLPNNSTTLCVNSLSGFNTDNMNKYKAFGNFLASSLMEMNETDALCLVEKFTADLVKALMIEKKQCTDNNPTLISNCNNNSSDKRFHS